MTGPSQSHRQARPFLQRSWFEWFQLDNNEHSSIPQCSIQNHKHPFHTQGTVDCWASLAHLILLSTNCGTMRYCNVSDMVMIMIWYLCTFVCSSQILLKWCWSDINGLGRGPRIASRPFALFSGILPNIGVAKYWYCKILDFAKYWCRQHNLTITFGSAIHNLPLLKLSTSLFYFFGQNISHFSYLISLYLLYL